MATPRPSALTFLAGVVMCWAATSNAAPLATLRWTNPCFNAAVDDSGNAYCADGPDSLHDLGRYELWGQPIGGGGWRRLRSQVIAGRECRPESVGVDVGWHYYILTFDTTGNASPCASNTVYVPGPITGVDLPPIVWAEEVWFDVFGRTIGHRPTGTGIFFLCYRLRGQLQKPATKVLFKAGIPQNLPIPHWQQ